MKICVFQQIWKCDTSQNTRPFDFLYFYGNQDICYRRLFDFQLQEHGTNGLFMLPG